MLNTHSHPLRRLRGEEGASSRAVGSIVFIGGISAVLYGVVYAMQRAIFRNGLVDLDGNPLPLSLPSSAADLRWQSMAYYGGTIALFALYVWLLRLCGRGKLRDPLVQRLALVFPVVFHLALLLGRPYLSIDVFSYLAQGYLGTQAGMNPYVQAASEVAGMPFGEQLAAFGWVPVHGQSPYGPLWTWIEIAAVRFTTDVPTAMLLLKAVVVAASLSSAALIWRILGRVRPQDQLMGTLVYLWNPLIIMEFAGEGHNDALMITFALGALALAVYARPGASVVVLALGVLTKYLPILLLPALLVYLWRTRQRTQAWFGQILTGVAVSAVLAVLLYAPLWVGSGTFDGIRLAAQPDALPSSVSAVYQLLQSTPSLRTQQVLTQRNVGIAFALFVLVAAWWARSAQRLFAVGAVLALGYALVVSPVYWPWYATLPIALLALSPRGHWVWMALVLAFYGRLVAPLADLANNQFIGWEVAFPLTAALGATLPLIVGLLFVAWQVVPSVPQMLPRAAHPRSGRRLVIGSGIALLALLSVGAGVLARQQTTAPIAAATPAPSARAQAASSAAPNAALFVRASSDNMPTDQLEPSSSEVWETDLSLADVAARAPFAVWTPSALPDGYVLDGMLYVPSVQQVVFNYSYAAAGASADDSQSRPSLTLIQQPIAQADDANDAPVGESAVIERVALGATQGAYVQGAWTSTSSAAATQQWRTLECCKMLRWQQDDVLLTLSTWSAPGEPGHLDQAALVEVATQTTAASAQAVAPSTPNNSELFVRAPGDTMPQEQLIPDTSPEPFLADLSLEDVAKQAPFSVSTPAALPDGYVLGSVGYLPTSQTVLLFYSYQAAGASAAREERSPSLVISQKPVAQANLAQDEPIGASASVESVALGATMGAYVEGAWTSTGNQAANVEWTVLQCCRMLRWQHNDVILTLTTHSVPDEPGYLGREGMIEVAAQLQADAAE